ncbi:hypothetical protein BS47DRAFT_1341350 [Hydnum rufescens UP504]|uniref:Uncharacterized protein n=1 Tax=Hydnum rufescens UP504 TaxID=1448309 RepID=A0A9P6DZJ1_9AGAM|nr:hypothetical protein BS47DRAFT_1341350 [Hydnum rufescens UP504]
MEALFQSLQNDPQPQSTSPSTAIYHDPQLIPQSEFGRNIYEVVHVRIPRVRALAKEVIIGITHAYEPGVDPSRTADSLMSLRTSLAELRQRIAITPNGGPNVGDDRTDRPAVAVSETDMTKWVDEIYARVQRQKDSASVALNILAPSGASSTNVGGTTAHGGRR